MKLYSVGFFSLFFNSFRLHLSFTYSPLWIALCALLAAGLTYLGYQLFWKDKELSKPTVIGMAALRFLLLFLVSFLLIQPVIESLERKVEKPVIAVLVDNSASMTLKQDSLRLTEQVSQLEFDLANKLGENAEVKVYRFSNGITSGQLDFDGKSTNIGEAISNTETIFDGANLAGVVLVSDGISNEGMGIEALAERISVPVYALGVGDSTEVIDAQVANLRGNKVVYLGNKTPLIAQVKAKQMLGKQLKVVLKENGKQLEEKLLEVNVDAYFKELTFYPAPTKVGYNKYQVEIKATEGESVLANNTKTLVVEAVESKRKIALIASAPHPDINAVSLALQAADNIEVEAKIGKYNANWISDYDGFFYFPYGKMEYNQSQIWTELVKSGKPLFLFLGPNADWAYFNKTNMGFTIDNAKGENKVNPLLNENFELFSYAGFDRTLLRDLPPVATTFGEYKTAPGTQVLMYQNLGGLQTDFPLVGFYQKDNRRVGVCFAEGVWQWRMSEFFSNENATQFDQLFQKSLQYLFANYNKKNFVVNHNSQYAETDNVLLSAELYDESFSFLPGKDISLKLEYEDSVDYNYLFDKRESGYGLSLGELLPGKYSYNAMVKVNGKTRSAGGVFYVNNIDKEALSSVAQFSSLRKLAVESGGTFAELDNPTVVLNALQKKDNLVALSYTKSSFQDLVNFKWFFFLVLVLASAEWLLRKLSGIV